MIINKIQARSLTLSFLVLVACASPTVSNSQTVYVTKTGKKYHKENCRYLSSSKISISLNDAKDKFFEPCKVCKPSSVIMPDSPKVVADTIVRSTQKPPVQNAVARQCSATTKAGTRCKRTTKNPSGRCWQHE